MFVIESSGTKQDSPALSTSSPESTASEDRIVGSIPDMADIIPLATDLLGKLESLEKDATRLLDLSVIDKKQNSVKSNLNEYASQLQHLKDSKEYKFNELLELRQQIDQELYDLDLISESLHTAISQVGLWQKGWLTEKKRWYSWQVSMSEDTTPVQLTLALTSASNTVNTALGVINSHLNVLLSAQVKTSCILTNIHAFVAEVKELTRYQRRSVLLKSSPPMLSTQYISQFRKELWQAAFKGIYLISLPDKQFFVQKGWIVLLQAFLTVIFIIIFCKNRAQLYESKNAQYLAARPFSAGVFLGVILTAPFYEYNIITATWRLLYIGLCSIAFIRLYLPTIESSWKKHCICLIFSVLVLTSLMNAIKLPLPLYRLYIVITSIVSLMFFLYWARSCIRHCASKVFTWLLFSGALVSFIIIIMELLGKVDLSQYLFVSSVDTLATTFCFILLVKLIHSGLIWFFFNSPLNQLTLPANNIDFFYRCARLTCSFVIYVLVLFPAYLMTWEVYSSYELAVKGLFAFGITLGAYQLTIGLVLTATSILYGFYILSWILQVFLLNESKFMRNVKKDARLSIGRLVQYIIMVVGFILAIILLGFDFTKLTIILSALGVGIGFGLQGLVNNILSGIIILFERPVRIGDIIELGVGEKWVVIKNIGIRATHVQTLDLADMIVPNADLIANQVTNWTLSDQRKRISIVVGVVYGSDVPLVMKILKECAEANSRVDTSPAPVVLFSNFGESSLNFELRVWIHDLYNFHIINSEIHEEIDRRFREANIEIAYPQQDLHLRSVDESISFIEPKSRNTE
jgi:small-conductance mechanosensitive channel